MKRYAEKEGVLIDSRGQAVGYELLSLPLYAIGPAMEMLNENAWPDFPSN